MTEAGKHSALISERGKTYGEPMESHEAIAHCWSGWLKARYGINIQLDATDAAMMMALMKVSRVGRALHCDTDHEDTWDDLEVYTSFGRSFASRRTT